MSSRRVSAARIGALALVLAGSTAACQPGRSARPRVGDHPAPPTVVPANATVERVIDGDTMDVTVLGRRERIRLIGIDTPETKDPHRPVGCYGPEAAALTAHLLPTGTAVRLERDREARDDYGRLLAYVFRGSDGLFVNLELAREGAASVLSIRPNTTYAGPIAEAVDAARRAGRGLWGACPDPG
jgi:micrococcal nuclease